jgi:hypothetical protein
MGSPVEGEEDDKLRGAARAVAAALKKRAATR